MSQMRPLRRVGDGVWRSRDGYWTFRRHFTDPEPQRWFAFAGDEDFPLNPALANTTLREAVEYAEGWEERE